MRCVDQSAVLVWSLIYLAVCAVALVGMPILAHVIGRRRRRHRRRDDVLPASGPVGANQNGEGDA